MTELHQAAAVGDYSKVVELLSKKQCSPNEKDNEWSNKTPLHWAAAIGHTKMVKVLLESGARPCLRTKQGWTPAHYAAEGGHLEVLQLLHGNRAPMDKEDISGDKPIRLAEMYGHEECACFLHEAEIQGQNYRAIALKNGIHLDDVDEEWEANL